jgi:predicted ATPase/class 3 adenylate cyclase
MSHPNDRSFRQGTRGGDRGTLPSGTVTFLFTDIEGSTKLLRELGPEYATTLAEHHRILREAFDRNRGVEIDTQGDAFFVAFSSPADAVAAAGEAQAGLEEGPVRVRMGVHTGEVDVTDEGYVGLEVHLGARIAAAGHGGQVIVSSTTRPHLGADIVLTDLGEHRLKDFDQPVQLFQLGDRLFPPLKTISNTNLPRPASSFIGRRREVSQVVSLLNDSVRLLTLTGPGGSGKTRLAIEAASELLPDYRAGVFWVGLATLRDPDLVLEAVAQTLGASGELAKHIGEREMLLLLDNFEQVVEAAPHLSRLVESCPNLALLVSSRELLRIRGEVEYPVPPLANPEAVTLFCQRSHLEPTEEIAVLCAHLDNLPLAVELAAARTKALSPSEILERLSDRLDLFKGGRDADPRQATLRATIAWSHDLLSEEEQSMFARLSVFSGGCTAKAAEAICDAQLDTLQSLVEKSLVRRTEDRFWMLETIREFAVEQLAASGEVETIQRRHFDHFLELARSCNLYSDAEGPQRHAVAIPERDNFRAAMDGAVDRGDIDGASGLAIALENLLIMHNPFEAKRRFEALLEAGHRLTDDRRARLLREVGGARHMTGDFEGGRRAYESALKLFRAIGDDAGVAEALHRLATSAIPRGELDRARALLDESVEVGRRTGRPRLEASNLGIRGEVEFLQGNQELGLEMLERSAALAGEIGFVWWQGVMLGVASEFALEVGRMEQAEEWGRQSLAVLRGVGDRQNMVYGLALLAWTAAAQGRAHLAGTLWGAIEAEESRGPIGAWGDERDKYEAAVTRASGPEFDAGRREGRGLSLGEAVELGVGD